jgi:hypothetical protein
MDSLLYPYGIKTAGINLLNLVAIDEIETVGDPVDYTILDPVVLKTGKNIASVEFSPDSCYFIEEDDENDFGIYYKQSISFNVPFDSLEATRWFNNNRNRKFIALYTDFNDIRKMVGSIDSPLSLRTKYDTGKKGSDKNDTQVTLSGKSLRKAYFSGISNEPGGSTGPAADPVVIRKGDGTIIAIVPPGGTFEIKSGFSFGFRII